MSLQGHKGISSFRCIKCNLTKVEWKSPNHQGQLLTLDDLANNDLSAKVMGQKQEILWKICPGDTVIPLLYC